MARHSRREDYSRPDVSPLVVAMRAYLISGQPAAAADQRHEHGGAVRGRRQRARLSRVIRRAAGGGTMVAMKNDRPNIHLVAVVDEALAIIIEDGPRAAVRHLEGRRAGFAVICRVLAEPDRRHAHAVDLPSAAR